MVLSNGSIEVNGMFIGCLPLSSLRHSSLSCFYNVTCLLQLETALEFDFVTIGRNISALNITMASGFTPNTPLRNIIDSLMIEDWTFQVDYLSYFNQCNVASCTYTYVQRNNFLTIFTKVIGLCK